jgi:cation diffusion facilitator family transporter
VAESNASTATARQREVGRVLLRVLFLNLAVASAKLVLGYSTGAVSVISDGYHSLTDSASNILGLVAARASRKPPDQDHPYGHRKYETLAAAGIFVFLLFVVVEVLRSALSRLSGEPPARVTSISFVVMLVTLVINVLVVRYESARGRTLKSELLVADAMHTQSDVLTSCAVLISLAAVRLGFPILDPIGALVVSVFIARTGLEIARETSPILADRVVLDEEGIRSVVMSVPDVVGCHQIRSRGSADYAFVDLHVWFRGNTSLNEAHRLSHIVKDRLMQAYPQIADAIIHIEPPPNEIAQSSVDS